MTNDKDQKNLTHNQYFCKADSQDSTAFYKLKAEMHSKNTQTTNTQLAAAQTAVNLKSKKTKK